MITIGYEKAQNLMKTQDWKARVTMYGEILQRVELYCPGAPEVYTLRRDSAKKLIPECKVCGRVTDDTAILCYDHEASDSSALEVTP